MSQKNKDKGICYTCLSIRFFLVAVIFVIFVSLTFTENLHLLSFVTSWNVAILILILGFVLFFFKLIVYLKSKN